MYVLCDAIEQLQQQQQQQKTKASASNEFYSSLAAK